MNKNDANVLLCAVLTTLSEFKSAEESILYLGTGCELNRWDIIKGILISANLVTCSGNIVTITASGEIMADKIDAAAVIRD